MQIAFNIMPVIRSDITMSDNSTIESIGLAYAIRHHTLCYGITVYIVLLVVYGAHGALSYMVNDWASGRIRHALTAP